jgi:hypothetical protein
MSLMGKSVVIRNLAILTSLYQLRKIRIPENYPQVYANSAFAEQRFNQSPAISIANRMYG